MTQLSQKDVRSREIQREWNKDATRTNKAKYPLNNSFISWVVNELLKADEKVSVIFTHEQWHNYHATHTCETETK